MRYLIITTPQLKYGLSFSITHIHHPKKNAIKCKSRKERKRRREKRNFGARRIKNNEQKASNSIHPLATTPERSINTKCNVP
jgi:hypothetical protein